MKSLYLFLSITFLLVFQSQAQIHTVTQSGNTFSPQTLQVHVGDTVRWIWTGGSHTTTSVNIPVGASTWNSPLNSTVTSYDYVVEFAGMYNYVCVPHQSMGMTGTIEALLPTNLEEQQVENMSVFPNPFEEYISVRLPQDNQSAKGILVWDITGKIIHTDFSGFESTYLLNTGSWQSGTYVLNVYVGSERYWKIVVKN
jgi:plastocyanin